MNISWLSNRHISMAIICLKVVLIAWLVYIYFTQDKQSSLIFDNSFFWFVITGFIAQLIDGTLGMAYGVTCTTILLSIGVPPAIASASVHTAEVFTTGVSGLSHLHLKNVDRKLFIKLAIPGIIGACLGAFFISRVIDGNIIKPFIAGYLMFLGILIILKSLKKVFFKEEVKHVTPLGFFGGLLDSVGGGGWGPLVASNIIHKGKTPQLTIGTVNTAEFFVAFASTGIFLIFLGLEAWKPILGLIVGGIPAAPIGALVVKYIKPRLLMFLVGICIVLSSSYIIYLAIR